MWNDIKDWFKNSLTILWARVVMVIGVIGATLPALLADPQMSADLRSVLGPYAPFIFIGISVLGGTFELTRRRTVGRQTTSQNKVVG